MVPPDAQPPDLPEHLSDEELAQAVRAMHEADGRAVGRALREAAGQLASPALDALNAAYVYDLVPSSQADRRVLAGSPYASMWEDTESSFPPRLPGVPEELLTLWQKALEQLAGHAHAEARLADLLFVIHGPQAHELGRRAARAQAALAGLAAIDELQRAALMARAIEISVELSDRTALAAYAEQAMRLVDELSRGRHPGPPLALLRALLTLKARQRPTGLPELAESVVQRLVGTPAQEAALDLAADAAEPARQRELHLASLRVRVDRARGAEGLARPHFLQEAFEFARHHGLSEQADELLRELQDLPKDALGFETFTTGVELPATEVEAEIDRIVGAGAPSLSAALDRLGALPAPGGTDAEMDAEVLEQERQFPLLGILGHATYGSATSAPAYIANDPEHKRLAARGRLRTLYAHFTGSVLVASMLERALKHHGRPTHEELSAHFATELVGAVRAERVARALELFWDGQPDESAHLLVPRLEGLIRDMARANGITVARAAEEGRFGGVLTLGTLLSRLRELYDHPAWLDYLDALLCDPLALNLRNDIAHAIRPNIGPVEAALLLQAACHLTLVSREGSGPEAAPD